MATGRDLDAAAEANALANLMYACSAAVDDFRLGSAGASLSALEAARLKDESQAMDDRAHYFTAAAIGATLAKIAPDLDRIKAVTAQAAVQLRVLHDADRVIALATTVLSLGTAIAAGDAASILAATNALAQIVPG